MTEECENCGHRLSAARHEKVEENVCGIFVGRNNQTELYLGRVRRHD